MIDKNFGTDKLESQNVGQLVHDSGKKRRSKKRKDPLQTSGSLGQEIGSVWLTYKK
jgi:hypothetical protein